MALRLENDSGGKWLPGPASSLYPGASAPACAGVPVSDAMRRHQRGSPSSTASLHRWAARASADLGDRPASQQASSRRAGARAERHPPCSSHHITSRCVFGLGQLHRDRHRPEWIQSLPWREPAPQSADTPTPRPPRPLPGLPGLSGLRELPGHTIALPAALQQTAACWNMSILCAARGPAC